MTRQEGFTLMETLVAMMIISIALVVILQRFSEALNAAHVSEAYTRAVWHAREKMDELLLCETLLEDVQEGDFGDGYRWQYRIEQVEYDSQLSPADWAAFAIVLKISWVQGRITKHMDVSTLTLAKLSDI